MGRGGRIVSLGDLSLGGDGAAPLPADLQCVGMIVGVYGVGYLVAAREPFRQWAIVLVGLLGKVFGPIGFLFAALSGDLPWIWGVTILTNDLIWWLPFTAILCAAYRARTTLSVKRPRDHQTMAT